MSQHPSLGPLSSPLSRVGVLGSAEGKEAGARAHGAPGVEKSGDVILMKQHVMYHTGTLNSFCRRRRELRGGQPPRARRLPGRGGPRESRRSFVLIAMETHCV